MRTLLLFVVIAAGCAGWGHWSWLQEYRALGECGPRHAIETVADAEAYAEGAVQGDREVQMASRIISRDEFVRAVNCDGFSCTATTDGVFWEVWFGGIPEELSITWGGRVRFTRCGDRLKIWGD